MGEANKFSDLTKVLVDHGIRLKGVYMIGAHFAQEFEYYYQNGVRDFVMFEPNPRTFQHLQTIVEQYRKQFPDANITLVNSALGSDPNKAIIEFYLETANTGASCSVLKPKKHLDHYPYIEFPNKTAVLHTTLDKWRKANPAGVFNFIQLDVQGFELEVLKGAELTLDSVDAIITEINRDELYESCAMVEDLDRYLDSRGFKRVATNWVEADWGDGIYVRK